MISNPHHSFGINFCYNAVLMAKEIVDSILRAARLPCISPINEKEEKINKYLTAIYSGRRSPLHYIPSFEWRRNMWGFYISHIFPYAYPDGVSTKPSGLQRAERLVKEGFSLIVYSGHITEEDFLLETALFRHRSSISDDGREVYTPLAYHQYLEGAKILLEYHNVIPWPVVTIETKKLKRNFDASDRELKLGEGSVLFQEAAVGVLNRGGILFMAGAGTRTELYEPPRALFKPVEQIINETNGKVAVLRVGIDIQDPTITSYKDYHGFNPGMIYLINIGETSTKLELEKEVEKQGVGIDRLLANDVAMLVRADMLGRGYQDLREKRLAEEPPLPLKPRYSRFGRFMNRTIWVISGVKEILAKSRGAGGN